MKSSARIFFLSGLFLIFIHSFAQNPKVDSLKILLLNQKKDTVRVNTLQNLALELFKRDLDTAVTIGTQALKLSRKIGWKKGEGFSQHILGVFNYMRGDFEISLRHYNAALAIWEELKSSQDKGLARYAKIYIAKSSGNIGNIYVDEAEYAKALNYFFNAIHIAEELGDRKTKATMQGNVGNIYRIQEQVDKALEYYNLALENAKEMDDRLMMANQLGNMAGVYRIKKDQAAALKYYRDALKIAEDNGLEMVKGSNNGNIGLIWMERKQYDSALVYFKRGLQASEALGDRRQLVFGYTNIGQLYLKTGKFKEAEKYLLDALELARQIDLRYHMRDAEDNLSHLYDTTGRPALALDHYKEYVSLRDSISSEENRKELYKSELNYEFEKKKALEKAEQDKKDALAEEDRQQQRMILYFVVAGLVIILIFSFFLYNRFKVTQKQKVQIEEQKLQVEEHRKEIIDSITYAKRIQDAILPPPEFISKYAPDNFVLYKPKDIVAGDFYWAETIGDLFFIAAADSTGHGVPGAMVSVVCSSALNRAVKEFDLTDTGKILDKARELVLQTFEKSSSEVKDGMDISLLCLDSRNKKVYWSGANNPLWYVQNGEMKELKADKQPIGKTEHPKPFARHEISYLPFTVFYLFTDGYPDQFGGPLGKKFKYKQLEELLFTNHALPLAEQSDLLEQRFESWKGKLEQVDDVCIIGIRL
jgi:serine phosphatase RsbU (regulator of sigma subunit)/sugar phosphate isomerase/epimerase